MLEDDVIREIRQIRDQIAAQYNYDVRAIGRALREEQRRSGRKVVSLPPKRLPVAPVPKKIPPRRTKAIAGRA